MSRILITGATGFVGRAVCPVLASAGHHVRAAVRNAEAQVAGVTENVVIPDIGPDTDWQKALAGVEGIVHLAARVHQMGETGEAAALAHLRVNTGGTDHLAQAAAKAGVRRFLFMSSIKVNGEATPDHPFRETDTPQPDDPYGAAKWEAEKALTVIAQSMGLETVILRPPLVYGTGATGNMRRLLRLCASGLPLPLGCAANRRSLIGLSNLADAVATALFHPKAAGRTYLVRDDEDLSVADLIRRLRRAMGMSPRLIPIPTALLRTGLKAVGRGEMAARLLDTLTLDDAQIRKDLAWKPPKPVDAELTAMSDWYLSSRR
jgi:nucleoside-diphosphate-sugar epimerase